MNPDFDYFLENFGQPFVTEPAGPEVIEKFRGKVPDQLLAYWSRYGFCGFRNGLFWITNPDDYEAALESWIGDTALVEDDAYYVIGRDGFGTLYLWGTKNGFKLQIDCNQGWILVKDGDGAEISKGRADEALNDFFAFSTTDEMDWRDESREYLFNRAVQKLGPLTADEVFAFEPALVAGGQARLENIVKRDIHVHLEVLAQFGQREILDRLALTKKACG